MCKIYMFMMDLFSTNTVFELIIVIKNPSSAVPVSGYVPYESLPL